MTNLFSDLKTAKGSLDGIDGNAFAILGYFIRQARRSGWTECEIDKVVDEAKSRDYSYLVLTIDSHLSEHDYD